MYKKLLLLVLLAAGFCLSSSAYAATIVWVSDNKNPANNVAADQIWVDLLEAQGYTVDLSFRNAEGRTIDATKVAALDAADLVIISRDTNSGDYANADEETQWNSVTTPIIMQIGHIARNNRWLWLDNGSTNNAQPTMQAVLTTHPIFKGVTLDASNQVDVVTADTSFVSTTDAGNGTLIAMRADNSQVWIVEWQTGQEFYPGAGQTAAGPRLLFCSGGTGNVTDGAYNLTAEGEKMFINAVRYMLGETAEPGQSSEPSPADQATDVPRDVVLSWTPGQYAPAVNGHTVYLSESFSDVNDGIGGTTVSASSYDPGRLAFETTYYWRVDEVNAPPDSTVFPGEVWSFTTEPVGYPIDGANIIATASSAGGADFGPEKTIDGSGLDPNDLHSTEAADMWLSDNAPQGAWIQYEFDKVYKLHQMWVWNSNQVFESLFGFGMKDVTVEYSTNGTDWTALADVPEFARAPGAAGYAHDTTVDFGGAAARYVKLTATSNWGGVLPQYGLSEVRFFSIPVSAREPSPDNGATDVDPAVTLTWRPGRDAATHNVYLSTDEQAVIDGNALVATVTDVSHSSDLDLGSTYYWRVDEVNEAEMPTTWQGDVWSFSTPEYLLVDGFEDYNDYPPHEIYSTWLDGYENPTNGSQVGYLTLPTVETTIVHGGDQSMPLLYSNTGGATYSEATRTFATPQDWTKYGVKTLGLWFHGTVDNTGQLYVKINGVKVAFDGDPAGLAATTWQPWNIDLTTVGVNLQSVTTLAIGIDGNAAAGTLYFDDIRLYAYPRQLVTPVPPDPAGLVAHYELEGNANDSAGTANGAVVGGVFVAGKIGQAISLAGADYVDCGNPTQLDFGTGSWTISAWVNAPSSTDQMNVFSNGGDNTGGMRYMLSVGETTDHVVTLTVDDNVTKVQSTGSIVVDDGQWHYIVGIRDGNSLRVYVDGLQDGAEAALSDGYDLAGTSQANAYIGAGWHLPNSEVQKFFTGVIDDVRVYNYALSSAEVRSLAGGTLPFDEPL